MVGDYAVIFRGYSRTTGDIDIWVEKLNRFHSFSQPRPIMRNSQSKFIRTTIRRLTCISVINIRNYQCCINNPGPFFQTEIRNYADRF